MRWKGQAMIQLFLFPEFEPSDDKGRMTQLALIEACLRSNDGTATSDDITKDLSLAFDDGGKWRGKAILELRLDGLIHRVSTVNSKRRSRNGGVVGVWRVSDPEAAKQKAKRLRAALSHKKTDSTAATIEPANDSQNEPSKESNHEAI
jgi:hypothetical protein